MNTWFYFYPIIGAITGWLLHLLATRYFLNDLVVNKKRVIAEKLGQAAALEFAAYRGLEEKVNDPKNLESILPVIDTHIDKFLNERLKTEMPMIAMFIGNKTTDKLKEVFMNEIQSLFPQVIGQFAANLKSGIDLKKLIVDRINAIPPAELRQSLAASLATPVRGIIWLGAISGFIIGGLGLILLVLTNG